MSQVIGIDLGTTSSRVAVLYKGQPVIVENSEGEGTTPSHVAVTSEGHILVGEAARRHALRFPQNVSFAVKRLIGRRYSDPEVKQIARFVPYKIVESPDGGAWVNLNNRAYSPMQISAFTLQKMKQTAEQFLGKPVAQAVITVPAYFSDSQRQGTRDAARIAGLEVLRIMSEPVAAALHYGFRDSQRTQNIVIYDLGGGTFDVSFLALGDGVFEVITTCGDTYLGGEDFDYAVVDWLIGRFQRKSKIDLSGDPIAMHRLKHAAESAKIALSSSRSVLIELPFIHFDGMKSIHLEEELTRDELNLLLDPFIERSLSVCSRARNDYEEYMKERGIIVPEIDAVVLVGGSTRIPLVKAKLEKYFGKPPLGSLRREDAVALGAAIQGGILKGDVKDALLLDVTSLSLGIETHGGAFTRLIDRNTTIPTKKSQVFSTAEDAQSAVTIRVFQGEREMAADNKLLGTLTIEDIPPASNGMPRIEVTFDIDANGIVDVGVKDKATNKEKSIRIQPFGGLSANMIDKMRKEANSSIIFSGIVPKAARLSSTPLAVVREDPTESAPSMAPKVGDGGSSAQVGNTVFVSYAREDAGFVKDIEKAFAPLVRKGKLDLWIDSKIRSGEEWEQEIFAAIERANVAILLLSNDFLCSEFIAKRELPVIFAERERRRLTLIPVLVRPCPFDLDDDLAKFQLFNSPDSPFARLKGWEMEAELARLVREIGNGI